MPKRRRSAQLSDENWSDACSEISSTALEGDDDNDDDDASFIPKSNGSAIGKKKVTRKTGKTRKGHVSASSSYVATQDAVIRHSRTTHTIQDSAPMRVALLKWYRAVHETRGMPWRKNYDPSLKRDERAQRAYEVWISEIMLQQTQVATVIPYYNRWMEKFPTIRDLERANLDQVNALWKGLGYYSRASRLLAGAQKAVKEYSGRLPDNAKEMEANIPGIGRYSAGAICSIAYGERVPVLDGNVHRLLSRVLALHAPPKAKSTVDILWTAARTMVEIDAQSETDTDPSLSEPWIPQFAGDINQALIELGSTICKVREPSCGSCPIRPWCLASKNTSLGSEHMPTIIDIEDACSLCEPVTHYGGVTTYPMKADRKKAREELDIVSVLEWRSQTDPNDRRFLLVRRPEGGLLAGLYEFPSSVNVSKGITPLAQEKLISAALSKLLECGHLLPTGADCDPCPFTISKTVPVGDVLHVFSHIRKTYRVQWVVLEGGEHPPTPLVKPSATECERPTKKVKKQTRPIKHVSVVTDAESPQGAVWTPLAKVMEANMGTGVVKVWNLTKKLWDAEGKS